MKILKKAVAMALMLAALVTSTAFAATDTPSVNAASAVLINADTGRAVSYTHLDVYKRQVENVLVEEINRQDETMLTGRTERNSLVHFKGNPDLIGQIVPVKIKENKIFYLIGERML